MAIATEMAGMPRGVRAAGAGIEIGGDRAASRILAARHTRFVRTLKFALPLTAVGFVGGYGVLVAGKAGLGANLPALDIPKIVAENLAMDNPHYEGFNKDGGRYWVTAKKAMQDVKNLSNIKLDAITGELIDANKERTKLIAARGMFNNKENVLELYDAIDVDGENGLKGHFTRATVKTKDGVITSDEPVAITLPAGTVTAQQMTVHQKTKEYLFETDVKTNLKGRAPGETAAVPNATSVASGFGASNAPIEITSERLAVNDVTRSAQFTGEVKAVQGTSTLTTPQLEVTYEGSTTAQPGPDQKAQEPKPSAGQTDNGKLKRVVATNPVVMTQGDTQQVTSRSADFDTAAQKAVLEGDVVMTELPDKRLVGDRAEIDQVANTVLLTGPVVLTQGPNELRGRRLFFNRANTKMNLTGAGSGNGRISARFTQAHPKSQASTKSDVPARGLALGGSFKTDPNAPIDVASDRLDVDDRAKQAVFTGSVIAQQAGFQIASAELTATYTGSAAMSGAQQEKSAGQEAAKLTRIQAKKNVEVTSKEGQKATGDWADYDTRSNSVTLGGDVVMTQGKNIVRGNKLVIDMTTGESVISTEATAKAAEQPWLQSGSENKSGGRPSAVFYPNEIKEKSEKSVRPLESVRPPENASPSWQARPGPSN